MSKKYKIDNVQRDENGENGKYENGWEQPPKKCYICGDYSIANSFLDKLQASHQFQNLSQYHGEVHRSKNQWEYSNYQV